MTTEPVLAGLARELLEAERAQNPIEPLSERHPGLTVDDAYSIQERYAQLRGERGARLVGRKIGATSRAIQDLFSIHTPDYGHVFDDMLIENGGAVRRDGLIDPMVEPELCFVLDRDIEGPDVTRADVLDATRAVCPCLEVIDSRITGWRIAFVDTVADNGSSARCILGEAAPLDGADLASVEAELRRNGTVVDQAKGDAVLGHPADAVAWLAKTLGSFDRGLTAGQYVFSGSFTTAARAHAGDVFEASFTGFGSVSCHFV